ncbi:membrane or secreted protein, partial [Candidatus Magnetobacterium bavaricum]
MLIKFKLFNKIKKKHFYIIVVILLIVAIASFITNYYEILWSVVSFKDAYYQVFHLENFEFSLHTILIGDGFDYRDSSFNNRFMGIVSDAR